MGTIQPMPEPSSFDPQALLKRVEELEATLHEVTGQLTAALQLNEYYRSFTVEEAAVDILSFPSFD